MRTGEWKERKEEEGMVLVTTLLIMVVIGILSISAMLSSSLEIQLAGNERKMNMALQFAEAGARRAGDIMLPFFPYTGGTQYTAVNSNLIDATDTNLWDGDVDGDGTADVNLTVSDALATDPNRIVIQSQGLGPNGARATVEILLVYAQGTGSGYAGEGGTGANTRAFW